MVKGVMQHGWYTTNPMVGAPYGLDFHDYPMAEGLHFIFYQFAGLLHMSVVLAMNLHYLLGYILIALTSLYVFLALRLPVAPSMAAGMLFAFMPHHWMPGEVHLMLSSYYMIPLTVLVILWLARGEEFVTPAPQGSRFPYRITRKGIAAATISVLTGSAGIYYAVFGIAFLAIMTIFRLARRFSLRQALSGLMPIACIVSFLILNMSPNIVYWLRNGVNKTVGKRNPVEADTKGLKMLQLLTPISNHRIPWLAHLKLAYWSIEKPWVPNNDLIVTLGAVASLGFLSLVAWALFRRTDRTEYDHLLTHLSILNLSAMLIATMGSFGSMFAFVVSPQIRAYSELASISHSFPWRLY